MLPSALLLLEIFVGKYICAEKKSLLFKLCQSSGLQIWLKRPPQPPPVVVKEVRLNRILKSKKWIHQNLWVGHTWRGWVLVNLAHYFSGVVIVSKVKLWLKNCEFDHPNDTPVCPHLCSVRKDSPEHPTHLLRKSRGGSAIYRPQR